MPAVTIAVVGGVSTYLASRQQAKGNTEAAKTQAESDDKALAQAKEIYQQQRSDQSPYRESGYGSLDALNYGLGLPAVSRPTIGAMDQGGPAMDGRTAPVAAPVPRASGNIGYSRGLAAFQARQAQPPAGGGGLVKVRNPQTGLVHLVPADQVQAAQQSGGMVVQ